MRRVLQVMGLAAGLALTAAGSAQAAGWQVVASANPSTDLNVLGAVAPIPGGSGFWAVGFSQAPYPSVPHTLVEHSGPGGFRVVASPTPGTSGAELDAVVALSPTDAWAVGNRESPLAEHWNGTRWTVTPIPGAPRLGGFSGVAAISPSDVWAVGTEGASGVPFSAHWNGHAWRIIGMAPAPRSGVQMGSLTRIAGSDQLFAVGSQIGLHARQVIERWTGSRWRLEPVPPLVRGAISDGLQSVVSVSGADVWAVGTWLDASVAAHPLIEHWNGATWRHVPAPALLGEPAGLTAVPGTDQLWATVGATTVPVTLHYAGTRWVEVPAAVPAGAADAGLAGIAAGPGSAVVAVGAANDATETLVERYP